MEKTHTSPQPEAPHAPPTPLGTQTIPASALGASPLGAPPLGAPPLGAPALGAPAAMCTCSPTTPSGRPYNSPIRQLQADTTRCRILDAAEQLLTEHGYTHTTIAAIARAAGVAAPTIYATFKSKLGILTALIDRKLFTPAFYTLRDAALSATNPREKLRSVTRLITLVYDTELPCRLQNLSGGGVIDPDLWTFIIDRENQRRMYQEPLIADLHASGSLRPELTPEQALDTLWALTARPLFAMLRFERGWTPDEYAAWLYTVLEATLFAQSAPR